MEVKKNKKLKSPTKNICDIYIALYIRFLKEKQIYHKIKLLFNRNNNNRITFIKALYYLKPHLYFSAFNKGWFWSDYIVRYGDTNRYILEEINEEWKLWLDRNSYKKYDWDNFHPSFIN